MKILYIPLQFFPIQWWYSLASSNFLKSIENIDNLSVTILTHTNLLNNKEFSTKNWLVKRINLWWNSFIHLFFLQFILFFKIITLHKDYDFVFFETWESAMSIFLLSFFKKLSKKLIVRFHASTDTEWFMWYPRIELRIRKLLIKSWLKRVNYILSTNDYHLSFIKKYFFDNNIYEISKKKFFTLPNTLFLEENNLVFDDLDIVENKYFLILWRLSNQWFLEKWIDDIILSLIFLKNSNFDFKDNKFVIIWNWDKKDYIKKLVTINWLEDKVILIDSLDNKKIHLLQKKSRACIMNSRLEWCSMFALECIFNWWLLISSDVWGLRDMVIDGYNWYFVKSQNIQDLSDKIWKVIIMDDNDVKLLKLNSPKIYEEKFSSKKISSDFINILKILKSNNV